MILNHDIFGVFKTPTCSFLPAIGRLQSFPLAAAYHIQQTLLSLGSFHYMYVGGDVFHSCFNSLCTLTGKFMFLDRNLWLGYWCNTTNDACLLGACSIMFCGFGGLEIGSLERFVQVEAWLFIFD